MKIALHDADGGIYPNLALMKLSAWHKFQGDDVAFFEPLTYPGDTVYSSKVFTYTGESPYLPSNAKIGGSGYNFYTVLPDEVEHMCPDYDLYGLDYSLGFLTRGCPNKCSWCFVPAKEGDIRAHADIEEFARHKDVVLMDNNVLASDHGIEQIEKIANLGLKIDFNQGLDARLIDNSMAQLLAKCKWLSPVRLACDTVGQMKHVQKAITLLRWHNCSPRTYFVYVLVKEIPDAIERVKFLKGLSLDPFAQPYRDKEGTEPTDEQKDFCRWVNFKAIFKSVMWKDYKGRQ